MPNKYAIIEDGIIINVVISEPDYAEHQNWIKITNTEVGIGWSYIDNQFVRPEPIPQMPEEIKAINKQQAEALLQKTDYLEAQTIRNTALTPHLINVDEIDSYRLQLRAIAINPPSTLVEWPTKPENIWSTNQG